MSSDLLAFTEVATEALISPADDATSALSEALRISGVALVAIFCVMGLFGLMILLLTRMFPDKEEQAP